MDHVAELTLQIVCFLQGPPDAPRSPREWLLISGNGGGPATFGETARRLAALEKPVMVGALNHPGYVGVWLAKEFDESQRCHVDHTLQNQQRGFAERLIRLGCNDTAIVLFEGWGQTISLPASEVRRWLSEYALTWGWTIGPATDTTHDARFLVLKDGRRWSPGELCSPPDAT